MDTSKWLFLTLILWLIWIKLFLLNFREIKKTGVCPFKAGFDLFEQVPACCKPPAASFKLADAYSEEIIS